MNAGKTKVMQCRVSRFLSKDLESIHAVFAGRELRATQECLRWIHKSGISGKLKSNTDFHCRRCLEGKNGRCGGGSQSQNEMCLG